MSTQWKETSKGLWPIGIIHPEVLELWLEEDPLDALRQAVCASVVDLIRMVRARDLELEELKKSIEVTDGQGVYPLSEIASRPAGEAPSQGVGLDAKPEEHSFTCEAP